MTAWNLVTRNYRKNRSFVTNMRELLCALRQLQGRIKKFTKQHDKTGINVLCIVTEDKDDFAKQGRPIYTVRNANWCILKVVRMVSADSLRSVLPGVRGSRRLVCCRWDCSQAVEWYPARSCTRPPSMKMWLPFCLKAQHILQSKWLGQDVAGSYSPWRCELERLTKRFRTIQDKACCMYSAESDPGLRNVKLRIFRFTRHTESYRV